MQVVVAGAGISGLTAALALARQGHRVRVVDRDGGVRPADLDGAAGWARRGVSQFHQPHAFLARLHAELAAGLPDVLASLVAHGAAPVDLPDGLRALWCRRSTLEWVLQAAAEAEPGVELRSAAASDVETAGGAVTGVRLADGAVLPADLVVDATGRRGRLSRRWSGDTVDVPTDEVYASRRYRLLPGAEFGPVERGVVSVAEGDGYAVLVFPHDAGTFSVCLTRLPDDHDLARLRELSCFEAATRAVPLAALWTDPARARPVSPVMVMGGLRSTFRVLDDAAPLGLHPLADAVSTSNPHFGRGSALAVAHALRLAEAVAAAPGDARSWRAQVDAWVLGELHAWFEDGCRTDAARAAAWRAARDGRSWTGGPPAAVAGAPLPGWLVMAAAGADPVVGRAVLRHAHLVDPPSALSAVHPRVAAMLAEGWRPGRPLADGPGQPGRPAGPPQAPPREALLAALAAA
ncbi:flavin-dependent dehydrogenase [Geodermatophilus normandii]|uniref:Flavin-dependent dehydrogenase n=1 Tax=Geodermatophilus normandii TaxID=1137989 RepID=A0A317QMN7_9ACTN|nr:FAD-dependent oxidoreductase [Geodermatophilus normandii]PWW24299.1 flavin-dependent dehydrogenase [Geodermatophilus normandii]